MILTGYCRLGKDAELRYTQGDNSTAVSNLWLAFNYGRRDGDGNRPTQWVEAALWGQRAESLNEYLLKGQGLSVVLEDVHIETYDRNEGGQGSKMVGRIVMIEFAGSNPNTQGGGQQQGQQQQRQGNGQQQQRGQQGSTRGNGNGQQRQQQGAAGGRNSYSDAKNGNGRQQQRAPAGGGFDEMDDDVPF
jgi:single-strand DNA-binding protein